MINVTGARQRRAGLGTARGSAAADLPAVRWKQANLDRLAPDARAGLVAQLEEAVSGRAAL
jgi:hypothetical protein